MVKYMFKKFFSFFLFALFSLLSFFMTTLMVNSLKELDPIMKKIEKNKNLYEIEPVNAYLEDSFVIPGTNGLKIDVQNSYKLMKKYGDFNDNLFVFYEISPIKSINNIYDKYISSGNKNKREIALVFKVKDTNYLEEIISILKEKEVIGTFFVDEKLLNENKDVIKLLYLNNQKIESLGNNNSYDVTNLEKTNAFLKGYINNSLSFCYSDEINNDVLQVCSKKKLHTIVPSINTSKFPYYEIKNKLENGSIIKLDNNYNTVFELTYIINYIRQNNQKIVSLEKLLEE